MWKRKDLKEKARKVIKNSYWSIIIVCFILAICTSEFGMSSVGIEKNTESIDIGSNLHDTITNVFQSNGLEDYDIQVDGNTPAERVFNFVTSTANSALKSQKYIYKIVDAVNLITKDSVEAGVALSVGAVIAILFIMFIAEPLIVGGKRFFIKVREDKNVKISTIISVFNRNEWLNIVKIMLLRNIFTALWYLTIVGGVIKTYEYRMIPYILADNPNIERKKAFEISKQMMKGNKWKTFILDISFILWDIVSVFTLGLLSILYVNPYIVATDTELYSFLKEEKKK